MPRSLIPSILACLHLSFNPSLEALDPTRDTTLLEHPITFQRVDIHELFIINKTNSIMFKW